MYLLLKDETSNKNHYKLSKKAVGIEKQQQQQQNIYINGAVIIGEQDKPNLQSLWCTWSSLNFVVLLFVLFVSGNGMIIVIIYHGQKRTPVSGCISVPPLPW